MCKFGSPIQELQNGAMFMELRGGEQKRAKNKRPGSVESRSNCLCTTASPGQMEQDCNFLPSMVDSRDVDLSELCQFRTIEL